ncbi:MAG: hypothetical protein LUD12_10350 [Lachnospiraceae bacterium]|nr:hypothetical protein [Lachnospiraceae bacterium]
MSYPYTENGYNMYDMLSLIQKAIRRGDYGHAGFAAEQLRGTYRNTMWNRLYVISSEDCFGILTKELVNLRKQDEKSRNDRNLSSALALMCSARKSRDACYFSCNFVLASRKPRNIVPDKEDLERLWDKAAEQGIIKQGSNPASGFVQMELFPMNDPQEMVSDEDEEEISFGACMEKAIKHRDMDLIGFYMDMLRRIDRKFLWLVINDYAEKNVPLATDEIKALKEADDVVNGKRKDLSKDEIFISKAVLILCYAEDQDIPTILGSEIINYHTLIDWSRIETVPIKTCGLRDGKIPEWTYDCHTIKGKRMGKTDWDMTTTEQAALNPLERAYFDDASWIYTYEQDLEIGAITLEGLKPIREFAQTHSANPVEYLPYRADDLDKG